MGAEPGRDADGKTFSFGSATSDMDNKRRIRRPKMAEMIARDIRNRIVNRSIAPGSHLPSEQALTEEYGVSRATLREGLRILESEGLLDIGPGSHRGPKVCAPDLRVAARHFSVMLQYMGVDMADVYAARSAIEPMAAKMVASKPDNGQLVAWLRAIIDEERATIDLDKDVSHHAVRFHEALIEASGNATLRLIAGILHELFEQHIVAVTIATSSVSPEESTKRKLAGFTAQEKLLTYIEQGDAGGAMAFWEKHLEELRRVMLLEPRFQRVADVV